MEQLFRMRMMEQFTNRSEIFTPPLCFTTRPRPIELSFNLVND